MGSEKKLDTSQMIYCHGCGKRIEQDDKGRWRDARDGFAVCNARWEDHTPETARSFPLYPRF